jgi:glycosyltransferase involved in cell wall biosynthesis
MGSGKILFLTLWQFEDTLIQTYTLPYVKIISKAKSCYPYLVTVNKNIDSVTISKKNNFISIALPSGGSGIIMSWFKNLTVLYKIMKKKKISIVHAWCTPAATLGVILKMLNKKVELNIDSYEPHAEAMVENGTWTKTGLKYKVLSRFEKMEAKYADDLIFAAPGMQNYIKDKYDVTIEKYYVKPACVDLDAFSDKMLKDSKLIQQFGFNDKVVCVYAGKFGGIYLTDETFEFIKKCQDYWGGERFRFLLLSNVDDTYVKQMTIKYQIEESVIVKLFVTHSEIAKYIGLADFAICPVKPVPSKKYCSPIKNGEYWALGLPVVITQNISVDSDIIASNNAGAVIEMLNEESYINAIRKIDSIISNNNRAAVYTKIRPLAEKYRNFSIAEDVYKSIYASLG